VENARITSSATNLLIPGGAQYVFTFEIGEDKKNCFPGYLGLYLYVDGREYQICLGGTVVTVKGKAFMYVEEDRVSAESKAQGAVQTPHDICRGS